MANRTTVIITLRKEVDNEAAARAVIQVVKTKMADHPEVTMTAQFATRVEDE